MCPESRAEFAQGRPMAVGEQGTIRQFTRGSHQFSMYARTSDPGCPVCLPDGAHVNFTSLPAALHPLFGTGPTTAVLINGTMYSSAFLFKNQRTATIDQLSGAVFQVTPSAAEVDHEVDRLLGHVGHQIANERPVVAQSPHQGSGQLVASTGRTTRNAAHRLAGVAGVIALMLLVH